EDIFASAPPRQLLLNFQLRDRLATGKRTDEFGLKKAFEHHSDIVHSILRSGYNFDGIDFFAMNALARLRNGTLTAGHGRYLIVILPPMTGMDFQALEKLEQFCASGGTVLAVGRVPQRVYGIRERSDTPRLKAMLTEMFGATPEP